MGGRHENLGQYLDDTMLSSFDEVSKENNLNRAQDPDISDIVLKSDIDQE
jgi:hypothetical protein